VARFRFLTLPVFLTFAAPPQAGDIVEAIGARGDAFLGECPGGVRQGHEGGALQVAEGRRKRRRSWRPGPGT
jgi:hypothetical protein